MRSLVSACDLSNVEAKHTDPDTVKHQYMLPLRVVYKLLSLVHNQYNISVVFCVKVTNAATSTFAHTS